MVLSFHKYWNTNDLASIQKMLDYRKQYNVPIWLGESGENSNVWFKEAISLMESNNIGWAFWPMKKIENIAGIASVTKTPQYDQLLNYWKNGGKKPTIASANTTLLQLAENYKIQNTIIKKDVIDAMFRQIQTTDTKQYKKHSLPGIVFATEYDFGQNGYAYSDKDLANYDGTKFTKWNKGGVMRNDGVDIEPCNDNINNGFQVSYIEDKEWLQYTIDFTSDSNFDVDIRYASAVATGKLYLEDVNGRISETIELTSTGNFTTWKTITVKKVFLKKGTNKVRVNFESGNFNLNFLEFRKTN
jgi:endoglucanase